jgi:hypothetical protein
MRTLFAMWPLRTESAQVEGAYPLFLVVFECAVGTEWTETTVVVGAGGPFRFGIDMEVETVIAVGACLSSGVV